MCACTGIPSRPDIELTFEVVGAEDRLATMKSMIPTTDFGETFQYSDVMVAAGGFVAAHAYSPKKRLLHAYTGAMQAGNATTTRASGGVRVWLAQHRQTLGSNSEGMDFKRLLDQQFLANLLFGFRISQGAGS